MTKTPTERSFTLYEQVIAIKKSMLYAIFIISPAACIVFTLFLGRYPLAFPSVIQILWAKLFSGPANLPDTYQTIVWNIRLPRALLGALVGASLSASGAAFQGLFRNPLVNSGLLGVSSGAGFGAAVAILLFNSAWGIYVSAFIFGLLAVLLSYLIATIYKSTPTIMLVLGGVIVSSVFSALLSLAKFIADPYNQLPEIVFWLMGSLASANLREVQISSIPMGIGLAGMLALRWRINVLSMGDKEAQTLGINTSLNKGLIIFFATLATAGAVCVSGIIGWVGLVVPHIGRILVGNDNKILMPVSMSLGASFMIIVDNFARTITGSEIPLGVITALIGAPFFVFLLKKTKGKGW